LIVGGVTAVGDCGSLARASAAASAGVASSDAVALSGIAADDAGIERKVSTKPDAANRQTDIQAIHLDGRADSFEADSMASFLVRTTESCPRRARQVREAQVAAEACGA
jgi:hypothetical protein